MTSTSQSKSLKRSLPLRCASESAATPMRSSLKRSKSFANLTDLDSLGGASSSARLGTPKRRAGSVRLPSDGDGIAGASAFFLPIRKSSTHPEMATGGLEVSCESYCEEDCVATDAATSDSEASAGSRDGPGLYCFSSCAESDGEGWQSEFEAEDAAEGEDAPAYDDDDEESEAGGLRAPWEWPREDSWTLSSGVFATPLPAASAAAAGNPAAAPAIAAAMAAPVAELPALRQQQPLFEFGRSKELTLLCERFRHISCAEKPC